MRVAVIGTGHVGLVTCVTLAELGHDVIGVDEDEEKILGLQEGTAPFFEPGLHLLLAKGLKQGRLSFSSDAVSAVADREIAFICVGTPPRTSGEANLVAVENAARQVARSAPPGLLVVEKSTVPAGTADRIRQTIGFERRGHEDGIEVVSNPEFLREGTAIEDSLRPSRILVGAGSSRARSLMRRLYARCIEAGSPLVETDIKTAELAKHASNAFLALKVSYVNALARMCERTGADVVAVADVMGADPRIGRSFLNAGLGYGGFCFPKDLQAFERLASTANYDFPLLREIPRINEEAIEAILLKVRDGLWNLESKRVALLGLAFKPRTDDVRFSPALALARRLIDEGASVVGFDPEAMTNAKEDVPELDLAADGYAAASDAHCVVICTEWSEFRQLDLTVLRDAMAYPLVVDGRNMFDPDEMRSLGFAYYPTGRPAVSLGPADGRRGRRNRDGDPGAVAS
jgi:UDPglucose 6-dehydrogenase